MPVIKPRTRGKRIVRPIPRLDQGNPETLHAYAQFIAEPTDYVLNELVESVLGKDKEFIAWREQHAESFVPQPLSRSRKRVRRPKPLTESGHRHDASEHAPVTAAS